MNFSRVQPFQKPMSFPLRALLLGVALSSGATGCQPEQDSGREEATRTGEHSLRVANSLTTQALALNAITTNPSASAMLIGGGLQNMFYPLGGSYASLQRQLLDTDAQQLMSYLVSCALDASSQVPWVDPTSGTPRTWKGKLGLCPEWKTGAPSPECKNRVSACLLARNNALGRRVELSLRGEDPSRPGLFALEGVTLPVEYDPVTDAPVPSYTACSTPSTVTTRDCGWKGDGIGRCVPGQLVRLGAGARAPDQCGTGAVLGSASGAPMMLRACEGITGCDDGSARRLAHGVGSCSTNQPSMTFTCPASGVFSVMSQAANSTQTGAVSVQEETGTPAGTAYPLSEAEVFSVREGAYFGNIFEPSALGATVYVDDTGKIHGKQQVIRGSVYRKMYSCQAAGWSDAAAYAANRLCALPSSGSNCAAIPTGTCVNPTAPTYPSSRCALSDGPVVDGDMDFEKCRDSTTGAMWNEPITVFLHDACALMSKAPESCRMNGQK
ncbi:hypothetical protein CYFUS_000396 [Cystobacter fuscus]|uniref:Lipoprotein n=1 Tax=Cystobacter fuscus TaxID=43 RepID=A0A250ITB4_9BACT|nr:hypothetical protein [Cystobacter fuscus]ATB34984.1 hypothetical protein CYFUS_000396 [Cystobacter fuscus]